MKENITSPIVQEPKKEDINGKIKEIDEKLRSKRIFH